jgi:signal transduction histidine kinase
VTVIDPAHLRVMLLDLATNARDAMPRGGRWRLETGTVELDPDAALGMAMQPGRYARLEVRDTGPGIPKNVLAHIFEPFYSTKPSDRGSGLGLATLYAIVSQYGGCVNVTSEPGDTKFEILLPSAREEPRRVTQT